MQWSNKTIPNMHQEASLHTRFLWQRCLWQESRKRAGQTALVLRVAAVCQQQKSFSQQKGSCVPCATRLTGIRGTEEDLQLASSPEFVPPTHDSASALPSPCCSTGLQVSCQLHQVQGFSGTQEALGRYLRRQNYLPLLNRFKNKNTEVFRTTHIS